MTTSLPPSVPETATAGSAPAASTLLDLLASASPGTTPEGEWSGDFAALLAPAGTAGAVPALAPRAIAVTAAAPEHTSAPPPTAARALQLTPAPSVPPAPAATEVAAPLSADGEPLPIDRATLEAALALVAAVLPPPVTPVAPSAPSASSGAAMDLPDFSSASGGAPSITDSAPAAAPPLRVTLTTPDGAQHFTSPSPASATPKPLAPTPGQGIAAPMPTEGKAAPAPAPAPAAGIAPAAPAPATPAIALPMSPGPAAATPTHAELEWEGGLKLSAEFVASTPVGPTVSPAVATPATPEVSVAVQALANRATEAERRADSAGAEVRPGRAVRAEKNAVLSEGISRPTAEPESAAEKNFLTPAHREVTPELPKAGIAVAQTPPAMSAATNQPLPTAAATAFAPVVLTRSEPPPAAPTEGAAQRAVDAVLDLVHAQAVSKLQPVPSVQLRFKIGHEDLAVRVHLRDGEVRTEFRTDNAELRAAVAQEWRAMTAKPEAAMRFLEPIFSAANQNNPANSGQGGAQQQSQQSAAQQQQQQQFRTQMELFGGVRRAFPAAAVPAELAPVTPLTSPSNHRLSAVA